MKIYAEAEAGKWFGRSWTDSFSGEELDFGKWLRPGELSKLPLRRPVVLVNGCFDILHTGHLHLLHRARITAGSSGTLIVALDSDGLVALKKGAKRPILSFVERASAMKYLQVDYITEINSDKEFVDFFQDLRPDLRVKDERYKFKASRLDKDICPTMYVPVLSGLSTSEIIERSSGRSQWEEKCTF